MANVTEPPRNASQGAIGRIAGLLVLAALALALAPGSQAATGTDATTGGYGYVWVDMPPAYTEIRTTATSQWTLHDATASVPFPAGFAFKSYGTPYTSALVSDNGFLTLAPSAGTAAQTYTPMAMPNPSQPNLLVAPFWVDLEQDCAPSANSPPAGVSGLILGETKPAVPPYQDRSIIVEWDGISLYGNAGECGGFNQFQSRIFEGTDIAEYHYRVTHTYSTQGALSLCHDASVGIDDDAGQKGLNIVWRDGCVGDYNLGVRSFRLFKNDPNGASVTIPVTPGVATSFQVSTSDDPLVYALVSSPAAASGTLSTNFPVAAQTYYKPAPAMTFTPAAGFCGTDTLVYQANDLVDPLTTYTITFSNPCDANQAPTAECTVTTPPPYTVGQTIAFSGTTSSDPDAGDTLTYAWTFPSGAPPTAVTSAPTASWSTAGTYAVSLTVTDQDGLASAPDQCSVAVGSGGGTPPPPPPPSTGCVAAAFTVQDGTVEVGTTVGFTDTSSPGTGAIVAWHWELGDGHSATGKSVTHAYGSPANYVVRLVVEDANGCVAVAERQVQVVAKGVPPPEDGSGAAAYAPPTVDAGSDKDAVEGDLVTLQATAAATGGRTITYVWRQTGGPRVELTGATSPSPTFHAPYSGNHRAATLTFEVVASDGSAESAPDAVKVIVRPGSHPPVADAGQDVHVAPGAVVHLDASGSTDADGDSLTYAWSLLAEPAGDAGGTPSGSPDVVGLPGTGRTLDIVAPLLQRSASFTVQLTVSDGAATAADTLRVWVDVPPPPAAAFEVIPQPDGGLLFQALVEADSYVWEFGDGATETTSERAVAHRYERAGTYAASLRVPGATEAATQDVVSAEPSRASTPERPVESGGMAWLWGVAIAVAAAALIGGLVVWALRHRATRP